MVVAHVPPVHRPRPRRGSTGGRPRRRNRRSASDATKWSPSKKARCDRLRPRPGIHHARVGYYLPTITSWGQLHLKVSVPLSYRPSPRTVFRMKTLSRSASYSTSYVGGATSSTIVRMSSRRNRSTLVPLWACTASRAVRPHHATRRMRRCSATRRAICRSVRTGFSRPSDASSGVMQSNTSSPRLVPLVACDMAYGTRGPMHINLPN